MAHYPITAQRIRDSLMQRINEIQAGLDALKGVTINTTHKTLTNRAISGEGARIGDYIGIDKALFVSYTMPRSGGGTSYGSTTVTAYSYEDGNGAKIGTKDGFNLSRTITPSELSERVRDVIESRANTLGELQSEWKRAESIAKQHNALAEKVNTFNKSVSYASKAQI